MTTNEIKSRNNHIIYLFLGGSWWRGHDEGVRVVNLTTWILSDRPQNIGRVVKSNRFFIYLFI